MIFAWLTLWHVLGPDSTTVLTSLITAGVLATLARHEEKLTSLKAQIAALETKMNAAPKAPETKP